MKKCVNEQLLLTNFGVKGGVALFDRKSNKHLFYEEAKEVKSIALDKEGMILARTKSVDFFELRNLNASVKTYSYEQPEFGNINGIEAARNMILLRTDIRGTLFRLAYQPD